MSQILSHLQAEELHKSIISYFSSQNQHDIAAVIRENLNLGNDVFTPENASRYEGLLVRKWTGLSRLLKKTLDLEARNAALELELKNVTPASRRHEDPVSWLPTSPARYTLESHQKEVRCIAFHPVFSSLASGSEDCTIKIWDWQLGELEKTIKGHTRTVTDLDFGGPRGKTILASCSSDLTIKLWDPANEYQNVRTLHGHDHSVLAVRFIPAGSQQSSSNLLASASRDSTIRIWDVTSGYCVYTISAHTDPIQDICPSFDGRFLLSTGGDKTCRLWDISAAKPECKLTMTGHDNYNECCAIAPPTSYKYLALLAELKKAPPSSSSAEFMATGSRDKQIRLWDARGICIKVLIGHDNWVNDLVFHPGGRYLLSTSDDKTIRCWDLSQEGKCVKILSDHGHFISSIKWAPSVVNGSDDLSNEKDSIDRQIRCVIATGCIDMKVRIFSP